MGGVWVAVGLVIVSWVVVSWVGRVSWLVVGGGWYFILLSHTSRLRIVRPRTRLFSLLLTMCICA